MPTHPSLPRYANVSRSLSKEYQDAADDFAAGVGKVMWAWNYSHSAFATLFNAIVAGPHGNIGYALWHSQKSDSGQRDLLRAAADEKFSRNKLILRRIRWALNTAGQLSALRNDAAHMATAWTVGKSPPEIVPNPTATAPVRYKRITSHEDFEKLLTHLRGDLIALAHFTFALNAIVLIPDFGYPLPRRPRLRAIQSQTLERMTSRRGKRKARQRRQKSSPG